MTHSFPPRLASVLTNGDGEPPGAVEEHPGIAPADRGGHGILNGLGGDAEPRHDVAARPDVEHRQPLGLLHTDVDSALRPAQDRGDLVRSVVHGIEIVTEDLDRDVATYPGDQLVEPQIGSASVRERVCPYV